MKRTLAVSLALALFAVAGLAAAQSPAEPPAKKAGPSLNLKLDERPSAAPTITFGPRDAAAEKGAASSLPSLGGPSRSFDRPSGSGSRSESGSSPYPKDTNPGM